jgi:hypothetical protein
MIAAAFAVALVSGGLLFTLYELLASGGGMPGEAKDLAEMPPWSLELLLALLWGFWAWVFYRSWRGGDRYQQLQRMTRRILPGRLLELLTAIPADAWAARRNDCYCARGLARGTRPAIARYRIALGLHLGALDREAAVPAAERRVQELEVEPEVRESPLRREDQDPGERDLDRRH